MRLSDVLTNKERYTLLMKNGKEFVITDGSTELKLCKLVWLRLARKGVRASFVFPAVDVAGKVQ